MSLYLLYSDPHLSDRAPSSCTDTYTDDLFDLIEQTVRVARRRKAAAVVIAGDVFHLKAPSRTSHRLVQRAIRALQAYPCPVFIVPGNHDITSDRLDSIHQTQPLGVLFESGAAKLLDGWADGMYQDDERREYGMMPIYGLPWLQGYGEYTEQSDLAVAEALRDYRRWMRDPRRPEDIHHLVVAHAPLYPPGRESPYEYFPAVRWAEAMGAAGSVFYGHVHPWHGVYQVTADLPSNAEQAKHFAGYRPPEPVTFCNNGALSRGSLTESDLTRQVGCTIWDSETGEFEFVPLDAKPASEVFRLQEKAQVTDMQGRLDEFLSSVSGTSLEAVNVESVIAHIKTLSLGRVAEDLIEELLTEASHGR